MNNIITCEPVEINVTPYGFYMFANDYYNVARKASEISFGKRINYPAYFLYCRSIELTIKSVLLASKKYSLDEIKTHDFSKLLPKLDKSLLKFSTIFPPFPMVLVKTLKNCDSSNVAESNFPTSSRPLRLRFFAD